MSDFPFDVANNAADFDRETKDIRRFATAPRPEKGWVRKMRKTIGMTGLQLATRMKTSPSMRGAQSSPSLRGAQRRSNPSPALSVVNREGGQQEEWGAKKISGQQRR